MLDFQRAFPWIGADPRNIMPLFIRFVKERICKGKQAARFIVDGMLGLVKHRRLKRRKRCGFATIRVERRKARLRIARHAAKQVPGRRNESNKPRPGAAEHASAPKCRTRISTDTLSLCHSDRAGVSQREIEGERATPRMPISSMAFQGILSTHSPCVILSAVGAHATTQSKDPGNMNR